MLKEGAPELIRHFFDFGATGVPPVRYSILVFAGIVIEFLTVTSPPGPLIVNETSKLTATAIWL